MATLKRLLPDRLTWRFGVLVLVLGIISTGIAVKASIDTNANTRCLAEYSKRQAQVSNVRAAATQQQSAVQEAFLDAIEKAIRKPSPTFLADLQAAGKARRQATRELNRQRALNPPPPFPEQCSEVNK